MINLKKVLVLCLLIPALNFAGDMDSLDKAYWDLVMQEYDLKQQANPDPDELLALRVAQDEILGQKEAILAKLYVPAGDYYGTNGNDPYGYGSGGYPS